MPFKYGAMPLRRTLYYLEQGKITLRSDVAVLLLGFHRRPQPQQKGAFDFVFWHFAQLQYKNPHLQLIKKSDVSITPFAQAFLENGREVLFDLEDKSREEIVDVLQGTLGKTALVKRREFLERMQDHNPAEFGETCSRHCICEVQGQRCCTGLLQAPDYLRGRTRWNHNLI
ncbi:28S ribosomal protein S25, mitochondrial [Aphelenchoides fujianensis]|nr:28S ribosomal protein S25, mitochondrial [Aphelenchoides fujianensis]